LVASLGPIVATLQAANFIAACGRDTHLVSSCCVKCTERAIEQQSAGCDQRVIGHPSYPNVRTANAGHLEPQLNSLALTNDDHTNPRNLFRANKRSGPMNLDIPPQPTQTDASKEGESNESQSCSKPLYQDSCFNRNSTSIANHVKRILKDFPTPSERYYDIRLVSALGRRSYFGEIGDQCIMFHSNRICLITLSPTHPIIAEDKTIEGIQHTFEGFEKIDRLASQPHGKSKKGGQKLQKNSPLCAITCSDATKYVITACMTSKLIEINQLICTKPNLIKERPLAAGFIAIIQPNDWKRLIEVRESLPKLT